MFSLLIKLHPPLPYPGFICLQIVRVGCLYTSSKIKATFVRSSYFSFYQIPCLNSWSHGRLLVALYFPSIFVPHMDLWTTNFIWQGMLHFSLFFSLSLPQRAFLDVSFSNFPLWEFHTRDYSISIHVMYVYLCFIHEMSKNKIPLSPKEPIFTLFGGDVAQLRKHGMELLVSLKPDWFRCVKSAVRVKENS